MHEMYQKLKSWEPKLAKEFKEGVDSKDFSLARQTKKDIQAKMNEIRESLLVFPKIFLETLNKKETFEKINEVMEVAWRHSTFNETVYKKIEKIFEEVRFPSRYYIGEQGYRKFVEGLVVWLNEKVPSTPRDNPFLLPIINSVFLNKYLKPGSTLTIKNELPDKLKLFFASHLKHGRINIDIDDIGLDAGMEMQGGVLNIKKSTRGAGKYMKGGVIVVKEGSGKIGHDMAGGVICVVKSQGTLIDHIRDGRIIIGESHPDDRYESVLSKYICQYISVINQYDQYGHIDWEVHNQEALEFVLRLGDMIISIHESESKNISNPTKGMKGGVVLLYKVYQETLGEGMEGGVLIIEDNTISKEEVKKRIVYGRQGGVIMMRVPDPNDPNTTFLEVVG